MLGDQVSQQDRHRGGDKETSPVPVSKQPGDRADDQHHAPRRRTPRDGGDERQQRGHGSGSD